MLPFIRADLAQFNAYKAHPSNQTAAPVANHFDRLDTNESPDDLPPDIKAKLAEVYQQVIETNRYPDGGHENLKQAIVDYVHESAGLSSNLLTSANISLGNGSDELIRSLLIATCLGEKSSILVTRPTFSMYAILAHTLGIPVVTIDRDEDSFVIDLTSAQQAIESLQDLPVRAVFVVHPNSPTANCLTDAEKSWLRRIPANILVVIDEAYFEFSQTTLVGELVQHPNWVVLRTFSKAFRLAAMRVGYCVGHPQAIAILEKIRLPYNLPSFSIITALTALQNRNFLLSSIPQTLSQRDSLIEALSSHTMLDIKASTTNFIYLRVRTNCDRPQDVVLNHLHQSLKQQGSLVRLLPSGIRITVGTPVENFRTIERMKIAISQLGH